LVPQGATPRLTSCGSPRTPRPPLREGEKQPLSPVQEAVALRYMGRCPIPHAVRCLRELITIRPSGLSPLSVAIGVNTRAMARKGVVTGRNLEEGSRGEGAQRTGAATAPVRLVPTKSRQAYPAGGDWGQGCPVLRSLEGQTAPSLGKLSLHLSQL
jgi:hypothetical protein